MDKRFLNFVLVAFAVLVSYSLLMRALFPPPPPDPADQAVLEVEEPVPVEPEREPEREPVVADPELEEPLPDGRPRGVEVKPERRRRIQLGSLDPDSRYRMLVTLDSRGAAVERIELKSPRYRDLDDRAGYLGHMALSDTAGGEGAVVGIVGPGTPAAAAGLEVGDTITTLRGRPVTGAADVTAILAETTPGEQVQIDVVRDGNPLPARTAKLTRRPLEVVRPESQAEPTADGDLLPADPLSLLLTLERFGGSRIGDRQREIEGVDLHQAEWWEVDDPALGENEIVLVHELPHLQLQVFKRFELARLADGTDPRVELAAVPAYHLNVSLEFRNIGAAPQTLAYRLDGPTGLPTEAWWYTQRISRNWWDWAGARDVAFQFVDRSPQLITTRSISSAWSDSKSLAQPRRPVVYAGVDAQYFSAVLIPQKEEADEQWIASLEPVVVSELPEQRLHRLSNVTCRLVSELYSLEPGESLRHDYTFFTGPKIPRLLAQYRPEYAPDDYSLSPLVYYGWTIWAVFARPMSQVLHFFYSFTGNYGLAIILLTALVRSCMFPISRKQVLSAQKMQELQPEMKKLAEKYKNDYEKRGKAMQEMYRKHNYNPLSGCLPMFIQLPIFIGLYRALMIDVELRDAPLITESFGWCTNLGAPDMLWYWQPYLPGFIAAETGWLGPYLNILPLITVAMFIWQQKMFMPPPTDEQAAMQQKVMRFMMVFIGLLFFKVASGLCLYFIASSLWGIAERKLLPKPQPKPGEEAGKPVTKPRDRAAQRAPSAKASGNGADRKKKRRQRGKR